jgi:cell division protein ZapA
MAEVTVTIRSKNYNIACDDGQEQRVYQLARQIDERIAGLSSVGMGQSESNLFVLNAIMMADEIQQLRETNDDLRNAAEDLKAQPVQTPEDLIPPGSLVITSEEEAQIADTLDRLTKRLNALTDELEKTGT